MVSNEAKKLEEPTPTVSHGQPASSLVRKVPLSTFELLSIVLTVLLVVGMMLALVSVRLTINSQQQILQNVQKKVTNQTNQNTSRQQEINELTSQTNLKKVASEYGLTYTSKNVRNVNK